MHLLDFIQLHYVGAANITINNVTMSIWNRLIIIIKIIILIFAIGDYKIIDKRGERNALNLVFAIA